MNLSKYSTVLLLLYCYIEALVHVFVTFDQTTFFPLHYMSPF
jgi:hypothetical protein